MEKMDCTYRWPYGNEVGVEETIESDVLVLGGGMAGCFAAIAAARKGLSVVLVEKGATEKSGSAGTGFDHWESACSNPCSGVTPEEIAEAYVNEQDWYSNGIAHYIECREGYDRMLDLEAFGGKVRDTENEFAGAEFRDEKTKLMFAYDYKNKFTIRVWGSTFKPALVKELKRLGVRILDRTEATALLVERSAENSSAAAGQSAAGSREVVPEAAQRAAADGQLTEVPQQASETLHSMASDWPAADAAAAGTALLGAGAIGMNVHTGRLYVLRAKATVLAMSRPARVWLFNADTTGLCEFRPMQSIGSGHAMGWRAGMEFTMMEKSVRAEFSAAGRSFPPYGAGNNHNTWYAATMVDARGVEIPYLDRDGRELKTVSERYYPVKGQKFFLKGGVIDNPKYEYRGPETMDFDELMKRGYQLPFYADLSRMPDAERRVIWGMMVGEEGKTKVPIYQNYTERGFDPTKHMLQSYGTGWQSASFLDQERQFFGAPGGIMHDWDLKTNIDGIYAAGDQLYASDCAGCACATGYYAGRKAADYAKTAELLPVNCADVEAEKQRLYAPLYADQEDGVGWKELNMAISKAMQNYCGGVKCEALLKEGLDLLQSFEREIVPKLTADNPHDLMRTHEVLDILTVAQLVLHACLARKSSSAPLCFSRSDYPEPDPENDRRHIVIRQENGKVKTRSVPLDFFGKLQPEYEKRNQDYIAELAGIRAAERENAVLKVYAGDGGPQEKAAEQKDAERRLLSDAENVEKDRQGDGSVSMSAARVQAAADCATAETEAQPAEPSVREKTSGIERSAGAAAADASAREISVARASVRAAVYQMAAPAVSSVTESESSAEHPEFHIAPVPCSTNPLKYDESLCIGCGRCAKVCQCDILIPSSEKGKHPIVMYPGECYYCGACVMVCPKPGALELSHPLMNRAKFIPVKK